MDSESAKLLDSGGPFEKALPGFAPRQEQIELAEAIEKTIRSGGTLVAEAGTGIGKTLSYLVPVLKGRTHYHFDRYQDASGPAVFP